jgi:hypothetical protein
MAAPQKITIELLPVRKKIDTALTQAERSIEQGKKAIAKATKEGRIGDAAKNIGRLQKAVAARDKLKHAHKMMEDCCCNLQFNCDPDYF